MRKMPKIHSSDTVVHDVQDHHKGFTLVETLQRLRHILAEFRWHTHESLRHERITATDARLLNNFVRFLVAFCTEN